MSETNENNTDGFLITQVTPEGSKFSVATWNTNCCQSGCGAAATIFIIEHVDTRTEARRGVSYYCGEHYHAMVRRSLGL